MKKQAIIYTENMDKLPVLADFLIKDGWEIISAGETASFLKSQGFVVTIEKSLLNNRNEGDNFFQLMNQIFYSEEDAGFSHYSLLREIKLVCVNVKPRFYSIADFLEISNSENCINFKQITLIRGAAKNYKNILILTDPEDYNEAIVQLRTDNITKDFRLSLAGKALNMCAAYDAATSASIFIDKAKVEFPNYFVLPFKKEKPLTQGTNPHQAACLYTQNNPKSALNGMKKIIGKEVDYTIVQNYCSAWKIVSLFLRIIKNPFEVDSVDCSGYSYTTQFTPAAGFVFTIAIKNGNPIGAALGNNVSNSFEKTLNSSPKSFDGATLGCSAVIDKEAAERLSNENLHCIIAPDFTKEAREILSQKEKLRLIIASKTNSDFFEICSVDGGLLVQSVDNKLFDKWRVVTQKRPTQAQIDAMAFGTMVTLAAKSDAAMVINDSATIGLATGQASRIRSIQLALDDAEECFKNGLTSSDTNAEVLISDTSIPFDEKIKKAADLGVKAILQTGGTSSDQELINFCNEREISMIFTGMQHLAF